MHRLEGDKEQKCDKLYVTYFTEEFINSMGERLGMECKMSSYDCLLEYKCFANDLFESFDSSQVQYIMRKTFENAFDFWYLVQSGVIMEHFPCHNDRRFEITKTWEKKGRKLMFFMIFPNHAQWMKNMKPINLMCQYYG